MQATHRNRRTLTSRLSRWRVYIAVLIGAALLAVTLALTGEPAAAQSLQPLAGDCVEVQGVTGLPLWLLCPGVYLDDEMDRQESAATTANDSCATQQLFNRWGYWLGHPGFLIPSAVEAHLHAVTCEQDQTTITSPQLTPPNLRWN
jgi:hypothetical protein